MHYAKSSVLFNIRVWMCKYEPISRSVGSIRYQKDVNASTKMYAREMLLHETNI